MSGVETVKKVSKGKKIKFALFTLLFLMIIIIIISEILLYFTHYQSSADKMKIVSTEQAGWWACDTVNGPRYVAGGASASDSEFLKKEIWYYNRLKIVNNEGYHDKDNFTDSTAANDSVRVLVAGDSFTWGASSDVDSSYVDVLERDLNKAYPSSVWNTGIPGTGTNHALFTVKKYLPLQKSNVVVLGFYVGNDFEDNLLPFDRLVFNKLASCFNLYSNDKNLNPVTITKSEAYKKITGSYPVEELNWVQKMLAHSRFIAFAGNIKNKVKNRLSGNKQKETEEAYKRTFNYLKQLKDYTTENNAGLIVMIVPSSEELQKPSSRYLETIKILNELQIKRVEVVNDFTETTDYIEPGGHWNNLGHLKTGHKLSNYLLEQFRKKQ